MGNTGIFFGALSNKNQLFSSKDPDRGAPGNGKRNFWRKLREAGGFSSSVPDDDSNVLLAVHHIRNRRGVRHVVQSDLPESFSVRIIIGGEPSIECPREDEATGCCQHTCRLRSALPLGP